jgi:hypothetical protein
MQPVKLPTYEPESYDKNEDGTPKRPRREGSAYVRPEAIETLSGYFEGDREYTMVRLKIDPFGMRTIFDSIRVALPPDVVAAMIGWEAFQ